MTTAVNIPGHRSADTGCNTECRPSIPMLREQIDALDEAIIRLVTERARVSRRIQTARINAGGTRVELGREFQRVVHDHLPRRQLGPDGPQLADSLLQESAAASASSAPEPQSMRRSAAQRVSWCRLDSCSFRNTFEACVSTVLIEMNSSAAISL